MGNVIKAQHEQYSTLWSWYMHVELRIYCVKVSTIKRVSV